MSEYIFLYLLVFVDDLSSGTRPLLLLRRAFDPFVSKCDFFAYADQLHVLELIACLKQIVDVFPQIGLLEFQLVLTSENVLHTQFFCVPVWKLLFKTICYLIIFLHFGKKYIFSC